jgi:hypothetical protein
MGHNGLGVAFDEVSCRSMILLNDDVEIVYRGHIEGSSAQRAYVITM